MKHIDNLHNFGNRIKFFFLVALLCGTGTLWSQLVLNEPIETSINLNSYASIAKTGQEVSTYDAFTKNYEDIEFNSLEGTQSHVGFTNEHYWVTFKVTNNTDKVLDYYFKTARPVIDQVDLYVVDQEGAVNLQRNGDAMPFSKKVIPSREQLFKINLQPHATTAAIVHIKSDGESLDIPLTLLNPNELLRQTYRDQIFNGLFYGMLLFALILYLFFFFGLKSSVFLWYSLYILFVGLLQFSLDGYFHQYITPEGGWLNDKAVLLIAILSMICFLEYARKFLDLSKLNILFSLAFKTLQMVMVISILGIALFPANFQHNYPLANITGLLALVAIITAVVAKLVLKQKVDPFFMAGIGFLVLGFIVFILNNLSILPASFLVENGPKLGTSLEILFLSISMSNRIKSLRLENEKNQRIALQREKDMNEIKSYFLSNLSHELRTPLNLIMGIASSMEVDAAKKKDLEKAQLIMSSSKALLSSINDITNFTAIEKGDFELNVRTFDLHEFLLKIEKDFAPRANEKQLHFKFPDLSSLPKELSGDKDKLKQVLNNLLDNAVKFTSEGEIELKISKVLGQKGNDIVLNFEISDTGIGISEEKISTAFESFTKHSFHDKRIFEGLGLGLYIAKASVDICQGEIAIRQNKVGGTTCTVNLPFVEIPQVNHDDIDFENTNILLVEDNKMNQMVIKLFFKKWEGATLTIANNGQEALEILSEKRMDLILMDLQMPVMDGFEAIEKIRDGFSSRTHLHTPIIVLTADTTNASFERTKQLGANDYMNKPILENELLRKMMLYLKKDLKKSA